MGRFRGSISLFNYLPLQLNVDVALQLVDNEPNEAHWEVHPNLRAMASRPLATALAVVNAIATTGRMEIVRFRANFRFVYFMPIMLNVNVTMLLADEAPNNANWDVHPAVRKLWAAVLNIWNIIDI